MLRTVRQTRPLLLCLLATALACTAYGAGPTAADQTTQAKRLYDSKQFKDAYPLFMASARAANGKEAGTAYLWAAHSLFNAGERDKAKTLYEYIKQQYPDCAKDADSMLVRLGGPAGADKQSRAAGQILDIAGPSDFSDMLEVTKPLKDHPQVSTAMVKAVRYALGHMPESAISLLRRHGTRIYLTTTLLDAQPQLKNKEGEGYDGYTMRSCPGMFRNHAIYLCERTIEEGADYIKDPMPTPDIVNVLYHECGHALSAYLGELSRQDEFKHDYLLDSARLDADLKYDLAYYLQKGQTGPEECCAELIGILLGKSGDKTIRMKAAFPLTVAYLQKKLGL